ncbi:MAG: OB-fold nucleic acid binding domain-containing protein, partial [Kordiimonas sp.]
NVNLPEMPLPEHVVNDYQTLRLSLKAHPLSFLRPLLEHHNIITNKMLDMKKDGDMVAVAGLVLVRQRPGSAKGVIFITLEDETGVSNTVVWKNVFEHARATVMGSRLLIVKGQLQREENVTHIVAKELIDASPDLLRLSDGNLQPTAAQKAENRLPPYRHAGHPRNVKGLIPKSRDFH